MTDYNTIEPKEVFRFFKEISDIPRGSGNTKAVSAYLCRFAEERGLSFETDEIGNVLIRKDGSEGYEDHSPVLLQGHVDMVCVKTDGSAHNFETDPIALIAENGWLHADGTSLGGDDGIAAAYMLALLDDDSVPHPPLETLFTVDEETGMYGAKALDPSWIKARRMINLDSEEEGIITTGCAGGMNVTSLLPVKRHALRGVPVSILVSGLRGGHSGSAIQEPVASANKLMGRVLKAIYEELPVSLVDLSGGEKANAISVVSEAILLADEEDIQAIADIAGEMEDLFRNEYKNADDDITIICQCEEEMLVNAMDEDSAKKIIDFLILVPHGVEKMSASIAGAVETSTNIGVIRSEEDYFSALSLVRSSVGSEKKMLADKIITLTELTGGEADVNGDYPAWEFKSDSDFLTLVKEAARETGGFEPIVSVTHGGLECGLISDAIPDLDIISIGPQMKDIHTFNEMLSIPSVKKTWDILKDILRRL